MKRFTIRTIDGVEELFEKVDLQGRAGAFTPSAYNDTLTMDGTAQTVALASGIKLGAGRLLITNLGVTGEYIKIAFGTDATDAANNLTISGSIATTGTLLLPVEDGGGQVLIGVPELATHIAIANSVLADVQVVEVTQGI